MSNWTVDELTVLIGAMGRTLTIASERFDDVCAEAAKICKVVYCFDGDRRQHIFRREAMEKTLVIIKPSAVRDGLTGEILRRLKTAGAVVRAKKLLATMDQMKLHYADLERKYGRGTQENVCVRMCEGEIWILVMEGVDVIKRVREIVGATNPIEANPGTIRGDLAEDIQYNLVHASDSSDSASDELALWFDM